MQGSTFSQTSEQLLDRDPHTGYDLPKYVVMVNDALEKKMPAFTPNLHTDIAVTYAQKLAQFVSGPSSPIADAEKRKEIVTQYTANVINHVKLEKQQAVFKIVKNHLQHYAL